MLRYFNLMLMLFSTCLFAAKPYFVSNTCNSTKVVVSQKTQCSFTTTPAKIDTVKDSSFSCDTTGCVWKYNITKINVLNPENTTFQYSILDSFYFVDTLSFSFFDAENDSCKFTIFGLDESQNIVMPDSIWGSTSSRPGTEKKIFFLHKKPFNWVVPGIVQISNLSDTVLDTISYNSVSLFNNITDSSFYANLQGGWQQIFRMNSYIRRQSDGAFGFSCNGYFFNSTEAIAYTDKVIQKRTNIDTGFIRNGWYIFKNDPYCTQSSPLQFYLFKDTLIIVSGDGCGQSARAITDVYIRDSAISLDDLPVRNGKLQKSAFQCFDIHVHFKNSLCFISFYLEQHSNVELNLFDLAGRKISTYLNQNMKSGRHQLQLDNKVPSANALICQVGINGNVQSKRITMLK